MGTIESANVGSKSQIAYTAIKRSIISNEFKPNMLLVERRLGDSLGISRTAIRIRKVLDPLMIENCFNFNYHVLLTKLENAIANIENSIRNSDYESYLKFDSEFQNAYINTCNLKRLRAFAYSIMEQVIRFSVFNHDLERAQKSSVQYRLIYEAYKSKDIEKAKTLMTSLMQDMRQYYIGRIG